MADINIAFGVTADWISYAFVTICSILSNSDKKDNYKFYIMSDLSEQDFLANCEPVKQKLKNISPNNFEIKQIKTDNTDFDGIVHDTRVGVSAYYRLKLASMTTMDKVIYLDSDIVVLGNISELWNFDINDYYFGAVEDKSSELMSWRANLDEGDIYINSGVLVMNLKKFREDNIETLIFDKLKEADNNYSDQDVLNDICREKILYLPLKYNLMLSRDENAYPKLRKEYTETINSPFILHYSIKPWILPVQYSEYWREFSGKLGW